MSCTGKIKEGIYNCFGEYDEAMCHQCIHNDQPLDGETRNCFVSYRDKIEELYNYLRGISLPDGVGVKMPKLSDKMAFTVIWLLQEHFHILPDNIEKCRGCRELFDSDSEGYCLTDEYTLNGKPLPQKYRGQWCNACVPKVEFESP